jgi:UDP-N-acetyl-D-glucosamine dehydrogenase
MKNNLIQKIKSKVAVVGIVGLGYVGLPLMLSFVEAGFRVLGFDIDLSKIDKLNNGESYIQHIGTERVYRAQKTGNFEATDNFSRASEADVLIICVPTPLGSHHEPDLYFVINTVNSLVPHLKNGQLVSLESTTYPGTTEEELRPRIESRGYNIGEDFFLVYSPEREDPGNRNFTTGNIPKVVGGATASCLDVGCALYSSIIERVVPVSSTKAAEMSKLLENIYRAVNIGLVNELKVVADRMGIDIWEVIDAAATKPFGFTPFYPGPGLGGHCIPIDPFYLTWKAREYGVHTRFIELAGEVNTAIPNWVVGKVIDALNDRGKPLKGSKILVLGIAYKKNIDDVRESPAVELMELLQNKGAEVYYSDPYIPVFPKMRNYHFNQNSIDINPELLSQIDCVLIATDHDAFDYEVIQANSQLIVDTRGRYRHAYSNIVKA